MQLNLTPVIMIICSYCTSNRSVVCQFQCYMHDQTDQTTHCPPRSPIINPIQMGLTPNRTYPRTDALSSESVCSGSSNDPLRSSALPPMTIKRVFYSPTRAKTKEVLYNPVNKRTKGVF